jgi:predicted NBD/HSP70 family sugar kinase
MDDHTRRVTTVPYFPKWENVPVEEMMNDMLPLSVMVGNDSRLAAYAVHWWGAAQDLSNFVYFKVGSCVGGAVITQGNLHRGSQDIAGEFGHLVVELNGPPCACGGYGCLELYASARGITEYVHAHKGVPRRVTESHADYMKTMETVAQRAEEGDAIAQEALDRAAQYLAAGIASVIYCTDPEAVVINWEPTHGEAFFIERVSYHMRRRLFRHIANNIHILTDTLDQDASAVGAATLHLARVYENPEVYRVTT